MNWFGQGNDWMKYWQENQKSLFQGWAEGKVAPPFAAGNEGGMPAIGDPMSDLVKKSVDQWTTLAKEAWARSGGFDPEAMQKLFDPAEWKRAGSVFDTGLEKLTEGPTFATLWDLDRKLLNAQKLWLERARDMEQYWEVVQGAWTRALERFMKSLNDPKGAPIRTGREMLDAWLETANAALVEMHRSKQFLEAQRRMTRSSTEYRLAEREIAEAFCEAHHIPTRTEMDEVQKVVTELRRELRGLGREKEAGSELRGARSEVETVARPKARAAVKKRRK
jgi:polyhydroxyalkanoate synthesis regulator phasin